jgi:quercetin dioxygenase-like cupin family protein
VNTDLSRDSRFIPPDHGNAGRQSHRPVGWPLTPRSASSIRFTPPARTAWHCHAVGQTFYVTEGSGLHQPRGSQVEEIRAGDIVNTPADQWHWHGAAPAHFMTHHSITEAVPGDQRPEADWGQHVTDDEYNHR